MTPAVDTGPMGTAMYVCMYVYSHKQSSMYNVNTEQDKKCRTERSYKTLITAHMYKVSLVPDRVNLSLGLNVRVPGCQILQITA